jgi:hypothetical protein
MYREGSVVSNMNRVESDPTFEQAVLPERRRLYGLALIITRDPSTAEDAVQETLSRRGDPGRRSATRSTQAGG